jgi:uncharacterized membrane protein YbaN (DUF454 family)
VGRVLITVQASPNIVSDRAVFTDRTRRTLLKGAGLASVGLGFLGAFLPLIPTTPFVLLAAACFARSSPRLNEWLHEHELLGPPLCAWERHRALPKRTKWIGIAALWVTFPVAIYLAPGTIVRAALAAILAIATTLMLRIPTLDEDVDAQALTVDGPHG